MYEVGVKKPMTCTRPCSLKKQHHHLELLVSRWSTETHTLPTASGELEDVAQTTLLHNFGEANAIGFLEGEDKVKLKYLTAPKF